MKQVLQDLRTGGTNLVNIPCPKNKTDHLLIRTMVSLISAGTERMLIQFSKANLISKARQQPEKVRQVLDKIKTDGLVATFEAVSSKLDQPIPLGYCNAGVVLESGVSDGRIRYSSGDRVVSNGSHAQVVCVPKNLCARIPDEVDDETAAFTVISAIGMQGVRLANPTLGEGFVVIGLGLIGLLTVQILRAAGCRVLGIDLDQTKCELARNFGAEAINLAGGQDPLPAAAAFSRGSGVDGVLITAATKSNDPVHQAAQMCRKRGRIILVGDTGLNLTRADFYEKELSFQVSCSYGPGRYDPDYEKGNDYPLGFVRWTEQRNFEAVLDLMATGKLDVRPLITHRFAIDEVESAYELIATNKEPYLGILLDYGSDTDSVAKEHAVKGLTIRSVELASEVSRPSLSSVVIGLIGAGNFTKQVLLPALSRTGARLKAISSSSGITGTHLGRKFGFKQSTTETSGLFADADINTIFITTRHNTHAGFVLEALQAGKHVFVEKPLCLTNAELDEIAALYAEISRSPGRRQLLMVGYNRRFAPHVVKIKSLLDSVKEPKSFIMTVNAGMLPQDHWTQDPGTGGGRIIGEACHFVDLLRFLAGHPITDIQATRMGRVAGDPIVNDKASLSLSFSDGSFGVIHYLANGHKSFPKERLEVFCAGRILQLENFRVLHGHGWPGFRKMRLWRLDKGHAAEIAAFIQALADQGPCPIPFGEIVEVSRKTFELNELIENSGG